MIKNKYFSIKVHVVIYKTDTIEALTFIIQSSILILKYIIVCTYLLLILPTYKTLRRSAFLVHFI